MKFEDLIKKSQYIHTILSVKVVDFFWPVLAVYVDVNLLTDLLGSESLPCYSF